MRIAFDARALVGPRTGVGVWLEGLLRGLAASTDWRFVLCLPRRVASLGLEDLGDRFETITPVIPLPGTLWLHTLAAPLLAGRADVFVATLGVRPRRIALPDVLVVHDVTPRTRSGAHTLANRFCFNAYLEESLARAQAIVCVSEATRAAVARVQPQAARRAVVIGEGVDPFFSPPEPGDGGDDVRARFASGRRFLVQLGTLEPRKGVATLLAAHASLLGRHGGAPDLVLAGGRGWGGKWLEAALARHPDPARVHLPGYVSRDDARSLMRHADVFVLASEEEGFGLPLAEALACGGACVASDAPALVEVSGGAAWHAPRGDARALAETLEAALEPVAQRTLRSAARRRAAELSWERPLAAWGELLAGAVRGQEGAARLRMRRDASARH
ncbi:MAG: glycosyltransferase family 1 protein [Thermoanaerobaculaceae bacterium]|jgi:glycosyltransferase involved in cell wall biosynthesis